MAVVHGGIADTLPATCRWKVDCVSLNLEDDNEKIKTFVFFLTFVAMNVTLW